MNAAVLLMTSAWMAGADAAPPVIPAPAPAPGAMMAAPIGAPLGGCCNGLGAAGCSGAYDPCPEIPGDRPNLFSRLRTKFGGSGCNSCGPVYTGFTTASCDPCVGGGKHGGGLFSKWRSKSAWGGDCCDPCLGGHAVLGAPAGCALPPAHGTVIPAPPVVQPAPMPTTPAPVPTPMPMGAEQPKPQTTRLTTPPSPLASPVSGPRTITPPLGGSGNPF